MPVYSFFFLSNLEIFPALTVPFFPTLTAVNLQMLAMVMGVVYVTVGSRWGFGLGVAIWLPFAGSWVRILGVNVCTKSIVTTGPRTVSDSLFFSCSSHVEKNKFCQK